MLFTEPVFLPFFLVAFVVHWLLPRNGQRKAWLLLCSAVFYGSWDWRFLFLLAGQALVDYTVGLILRKQRPLFGRKFWLILCITINLVVLGVFKYLNFFLDSGAGALTWLGMPVGHRALNIILPIGISFVTFQSMSYTIDVYQGKLKPITSLVDYGLFISFFTHLVAGPIVRASHLLPQLAEPRRLTRVNFRWCFSLLLIGFIKKSLVSDRLAGVVDQVFADPARFDALSIWTATLFYAAQIYCDFSGYTDMAIALAGLLGYDLGLNFNFPYLARNITEFWRRWHISLSAWLRDYLYVPLGGNRGGRWAAYRNLMITMLLGGIWHGAGWNFAVWGGLHGFALIAHKEWCRRVPAEGRWSRVLALAGPLLTFYWVCLAWIFFRAQTLPQALTACKSFVLLASPGTESVDPRLIGILIPLGLLHWFSSRGGWDGYLRRLPSWAYATAYGAAVAAVLFFVPLNVRPFIYFQF
jgi:alginate O-acetyltransferase complex protein AlgI